MLVEELSTEEEEDREAVSSDDVINSLWKNGMSAMTSLRSAILTQL